MNLLSPRFSVPAFALALLLGSTNLRAAVGGIEDGGAFFSEFARVNASGTIREVGSKLHKDIVVTTFAEVPVAVKSTVFKSDKAATNRGFSQWAEDLARAKGVNGVFILLVKQPAHLQVVVGSDTQRQAFTLTDREALVQRMIGKLRSKQNDEALLDAVSFISTTMTSHRSGVTTQASRPRVSAPSQGISSWLPTIGIVLLIWVGFSIVRSLFRGASGGGGGIGSMGQPTGGGFFQNMMGSMFGAAAGMWMYDQFFGSHTSSAYGAEPSDSSQGDSGFTGTDTDYTSSGGSFSDDSGSSFGGGDSGGGGDFGGGGGDF